MMSKIAKVSILVRTKNRTLTLDQALSGIVRQTFTDWHIHLLNDGGDENAVLETVAKYADALQDRISIHTNEKSVGRGGALAQLLNYAREDYILIHDDDDTIEPEFLAMTVAVLDDASNAHCCAVVTSNYDVHATIDGDEIREIRKIANGGRRPNSYVDFMEFVKAKFSLFTTNSCLFKRESCTPYIHIISDMNYHEDKTLFKYMMLEGEFKTIEPHLSSYYHYCDVNENYKQTNSFNDLESILESNNSMRKAIRDNNHMDKFVCMMQDGRRNKDTIEFLIVTAYNNIFQSINKNHEDTVQSLHFMTKALQALNTKVEMLEKK